MNFGKKEKILVLVTAQKKSLRLIDYGFSLSLANDGELHILHVQKGNSIFEDKNFLKRLQGLVDYGSKLGACIHVQCAHNVAECIGDFVEKEAITRVVLGNRSQEDKTELFCEMDNIISIMPTDVKMNVPIKEEVKQMRLIV